MSNMQWNKEELFNVCGLYCAGSVSLEQPLAPSALLILFLNAGFCLLTLSPLPELKFTFSGNVKRADKARAKASRHTLRHMKKKKEEMR